MSTTTITGTIHGVNNTALSNKWINFRLAQLGTDAVASVTVAESVDSVQTDANGNFSIDVWNNGDSGTTSLLEIAVEGSDTQYVVMPKDVASIELWDLIENYQAEGNTSQVPVVSDLFLRKSTNLGDVPNKILASQNLNLAIGTNVQAHSSVLDATDAIFTVSKDAAISQNTTKTATNEGNIATNATAIALNTAKDGITIAQANAIVDNTAKDGVTTAQANAIVANTAKVSNATHTGDVTGDTALTITDSTVTVAKISASGTPTAQSFLSGAGTWTIPAGSGGSGDMQSATYDPLTIQSNAFDMANMAESISAKILTQAERNLITEIPANTAKVGISQAQADAIVVNTNKIPNASTTGTPSTTTFLNGANEWVVPAGGGSGDMLSSVYDPTLVIGDAFDMDNMVEGTNNKILTPTERSEIIANTNKVGITTEQNNAIVANTAKVTNATHTGDVTGNAVLTIAADAVDISMLSATGTPSATTFLRGDNQWETPAGGGGGDVATDAIWNAVGDLAVGTGSDSASVLPIGQNSQVLTSNGTIAFWADPSAEPAISLDTREIDLMQYQWTQFSNAVYFFEFGKPISNRPWFDLWTGIDGAVGPSRSFGRLTLSLGGWDDPEYDTDTEVREGWNGPIDYDKRIEISADMWIKNWQSAAKQQDRSFLLVGRNAIDFGDTNLADKGFGIRISGQGVFIWTKEFDGSATAMTQLFIGQPFGTSETTPFSNFRIISDGSGLIQVYLNGVFLGQKTGGPTGLGNVTANKLSLEVTIGQLDGELSRKTLASYRNIKTYVANY